MRVPLAERMRPSVLEDFAGQDELLGPGKLLRRIIEANEIPSMVFYGPSGIGKTTLAAIIANTADKMFYKLNGTNASTSDIKKVIEETDSLAGYKGVLLYLDEIQYFNKKQQQSLLPYIENGDITLIASTTENPYFYIYNALLSRCTVFEFKPLKAEDIKKILIRAIKLEEKEREIEINAADEVIDYIALGSGGDVRKSLNALEMCIIGAAVEGSRLNLTLEDAKQVSSKSSMRYDRDGDEHYNILSAFQKSIRGSDENAALHYLARLILAGDLPSICRRLLVTAAEDIGLAYPQAITIVKACVDSALQLGLPEARIPLAEAVILLATAPKSNSAVTAIDEAINDIKEGRLGDIPSHLKDSHYSAASRLGAGIGYKYPHSYENNYVSQQYLPDIIRDRVYYNYGDNRNERAAKAYWDKIKYNK